MIMKTGEQWHCMDPVCRCEVIVQLNSEKEGGNPRCVCGSSMKKKYSPPTFTYLDFLRADQPVAAHDRTRKP